MEDIQLRFRAGATFERTFEWRNKDKIIHLEGVEAFVQIADSGLAAAKTQIPDENMVINEPCDIIKETGDIFFSLYPDQTKVLTRPTYALRLKLIFNDGSIFFLRWIPMVSEHLCGDC